MTGDTDSISWLNFSFKKEAEIQNQDLQCWNVKSIAAIFSYNLRSRVRISIFIYKSNHSHLHKEDLGTIFTGEDPLVLGLILSSSLFRTQDC